MSTPVNKRIDKREKSKSADPVRVSSKPTTKAAKNAAGADNKVPKPPSKEGGAAPAAKGPDVGPPAGTDPPKAKTKPTKPRQKHSCAPGLSVEVMGELQKRFPDFELEQCEHGIPHAHPMCHTERGLMEARIVRLLPKSTQNGYIVDIGGNSKRHAQRKTGVWSCTPILSSADASRSHNNVNTPNQCFHKAEECDCVQPIAYMSVDSIYYLDPEVVCQLVHRSLNKKLIAAIHPHNTPQGSRYHGEYQWTTDSDFNVVVHVHGNLQPYVHPRCEWLRKGYYSNGVEAIAWHEKFSTGDMDVLEFSSANASLPTPIDYNCPFTTAVSDSKHYGFVDLKTALVKDGFYPEYISQALPKSAAYSFGSTLLTFSTKDEMIILPKPMLQYAAATICGQTRDASSFSSLLVNVKRHSLNYQIPAEQRPMAVFHCTVLGFLMHAQEEAVVMNSMVGTKMPWLHKLNEQLKFRFGWHVQFSKLAFYVLAAFGLFTGINAAAWSFPRLLGTRAIGLKALNYKIGVLALLAGVGFLQRRISLALAEKAAFVDGAFSHYAATRESSAHPEPMIIPRAPLTPIPATVSTKPLDEPHADAEIKTPTDVVDKTHLPGAYATGLTTVCAMPVVSATHTDNEVIAVTNRGCFDRPQPNAALCREFRVWIKCHKDVLFTDTSPIVANFEEWNSRFPLEQQKRHLKALTDLPDDDPDVSEYVKRKSFIKKEKLLKSGVGRFEDYNPRLIQGADDHMNVITGPWIYAFSKRLQKIWGINNLITYAGGLTGDQIGEWHDLHSHDAIGATDDAKYWDATYNEEKIKTEFMIYDLFECPKAVKHALVKQYKTEGVTPLGVRYTCSATRKSGDPNTSVGNSLHNGLEHTFAFHKVYARGSKDRLLKHSPATIGSHMIVMGDDNACLLDSTKWCMIAFGHDERFDPVDAEVVIKMFGTIPKFKVMDNPYAMDFCSALFLRAIDPDTNTVRTVLTPKPGRIFAKFGYSLKKPANVKMQIRADALGLIQDVAHCPGLREYIQAALRTTKDVKPAKIQSDHKFHLGKKLKLSDESYPILENWYGVTKRQLDDLEAFLRTIDDPFVVINHPVITHLTDVDSE